MGRLLLLCHLVVFHALGGNFKEDKIVAELRQKFIDGNAPDESALFMTPAFNCRQFSALTGNFDVREVPEIYQFVRYAGNIFDNKRPFKEIEHYVAASDGLIGTNSLGWSDHIKQDVSGSLVTELSRDSGPNAVGEASVSVPTKIADSYMVCAPIRVTYLKEGVYIAPHAVPHTIQYKSKYPGPIQFVNMIHHSDETFVRLVECSLTGTDCRVIKGPGNGKFEITGEKGYILRETYKYTFSWRRPLF